MVGTDVWTYSRAYDADVRVPNENVVDSHTMPSRVFRVAQAETSRRKRVGQSSPVVLKDQALNRKVEIAGDDVRRVFLNEEFGRFFGDRDSSLSLVGHRGDESHVAMNKSLQTFSRRWEMNRSHSNHIFADL